MSYLSSYAWQQNPTMFSERALANETMVIANPASLNPKIDYLDCRTTQLDDNTVELDINLIKPLGVRTVRLILWYNDPGAKLTFTEIQKENWQSLIIPYDDLSFPTEYKPTNYNTGIMFTRSITNDQSQYEDRTRACGKVLFTINDVFTRVIRFPFKLVLFDVSFQDDLLQETEILNRAINVNWIATNPVHKVDMTISSISGSEHIDIPIVLHKQLNTYVKSFNFVIMFNSSQHIIGQPAFETTALNEDFVYSRSINPIYYPEQSEYNQFILVEYDILDSTPDDNLLPSSVEIGYFRINTVRSYLLNNEDFQVVFCRI